MDIQINELIEATREQAKYELARVRLEEERLVSEKLRLDEERRKAAAMELLLKELTVTNDLIRNKILPNSTEQSRLLSINAEIQKIILLTLMTISDKAEERERLKIILSALGSSDIKIDVRGDAEKIIGKKE